MPKPHFWLFELTVGTVTQVSSPTVPFGEVLSQSPAAGASVLTGSAVDLSISIANLPSGDLIRPAVQITLPTASVALNEPVTITVVATDGGGIASITLLINGTSVALDGNCRIWGTLQGSEGYARVFSCRVVLALMPLGFSTMLWPGA